MGIQSKNELPAQAAEKKLTRPERSWVMYDVANPAFTMIISTTIPILFHMIVTKNGYEASQATAMWGSASSVAILILAVLSPILGAVADYNGMKKKLFVFSLLLGAAGALIMSFMNFWLAYLIFFVIARLGYAASCVFYDSMLTDVTTDERMDRISSYGYAFGYIGSCIPFIAGIVILLLLGTTNELSYRISFLVTIAWWVVLTIPLLKDVRQTHFLEDRPDKIANAFHRLGETLKKLKNDKKLLYFILGYFFYIDGVYTIISMATTYGAEVGITSMNMILALLLTQFVAFPCAILSGRLAEKFGAVNMIKIYILMYTCIAVFGFFLHQQWQFWVLAVSVGMCQGGIQALSRSYFGSLIPKDESNEYFGFYDIFGKFADFFGPILLAVSASLFGASRYGILALILLFIIGFALIISSQKQIIKNK